MKFTSLSITSLVVSLTVAGMCSVAHAAEVKDEEKDSQTQVSIVDSPDSDKAVLKLIAVPDQYKFETKSNSNGSYQIQGGTVSSNKNITVFNDKLKQTWSVKASVEDTILKTASNKKATVTGFKINGQELMGEKATQIVHKSAEKPTLDNNTGYISKEVTNDGLSITFNNEKNDLKAGDVLNGTIHYQLYDTPSAT